MAKKVKRLAGRDSKANAGGKAGRLRGAPMAGTRESKKARKGIAQGMANRGGAQRKLSPTQAQGIAAGNPRIAKARARAMKKLAKKGKSSR